MDKLIGTVSVPRKPDDHIILRTFAEDSVIDDFNNEPQEWKDLVANITVTSLSGKTPQSQLNMALRLLKKTLIHRFKTPCISKLVEGSNVVNESIKFSVAATEVSHGFSWSRSTALNAFRVMCKVLSCTTVASAFTKTIKLLPAKKERCVILGKRYSSRPSNDTGRMMVESWVRLVRENTNCKSDLSIRNIMAFFFNVCLPAFGLDVDTWPADAKEIVQAKFNETTLTQICHGKNNGKKACWLQVLLVNIVGTNCIIDNGMRKRLAISCLPTTDDRDDDGGDHHRISSDDLDKLFLACSDTMPQKLMFMLMITTGVRIGGLTNIRIARVAELEGNRWVVKDMGQTVCKNNKPFGFSISADVKDLIVTWLHEHRPADPSPFLFPGGAGGKMSTATVREQFNGICSKAGLNGEQFHPRALHHSFARILLESGNDVTLIAKNLSSSVKCSTTEKFYLKESVEELTVI